MQLAAAGWTVTALDKSARRLERLSANLARTGLAADVVQGDALKWQPDDMFDAVLLDAPCSATGTCRRHPDVLHRLAAMDDLTQLQAQMLARAADWLRPGGTLVYATCSLEPPRAKRRPRSLLRWHPPRSARMNCRRGLPRPRRAGCAAIRACWPMPAVSTGSLPRAGARRDRDGR
jgi:16S rRNA C967 or C1407 C5-methylase (RsmB/RsmF family)